MTWLICQVCHTSPCACATGGWQTIRCSTCFQMPCKCSGIGTGTVSWTGVFGHPGLTDAEIKKIVDGVALAIIEHSRPETYKSELEAIKKERDASRAELEALKKKLAELGK